MLSLQGPSIYQSAKCFVTYGAMVHLDPDQVPTKGKPWAQIQDLDFIHAVELVIPAECYEVLHRKLVEERDPPKFCRVVMRLADVLDRAFFYEYVKRGDILMISEGRTTVDRVFTIRHGTLTMYLDREAYERAGLVGVPHGVKGKRSGKPRWVVTYDLHGSSMFHGKKAFDRLLYACKNVFGEPITWLFCNYGAPPKKTDPIEKYPHTATSASPVITRDIPAAIPPLAPPPTLPHSWDRTLLEEYATQTYEWLSLVRLQSPRVRVDDKIDRYLSTYNVPLPDSLAPEPISRSTAGAVCTLAWEGLISSAWLRATLVQIIGSVPSNQWFSLSATTFARGLVGDADELALLRPRGEQQEYVMWEIKGEHG